jgi:hypothetical protein
MVCLELVNGMSITVEGDDPSRVAQSIAGRGSTMAAGFFSRLEDADGRTHYLNPQHIVRIYVLDEPAGG